MDLNQNKQRSRSISFPSLGLQKALDKALIVYEKERRHAVAADVVAQHLGYKNTRNGPAGRLLSTLKQFGLCDRPKEGHISVTKDFEIYHLESDPAKKATLLHKFAKSPPAFDLLFNHFGLDFPSDASLKQFLILEAGVINTSADDFIRSFRETIDFSKITIDSSKKSNNHEIHIESHENPLPPLPDAGIAMPQAAINTKQQHQSIEKEKNTSPEYDRVPIRLSGGRRAWVEIPLVFFKNDREIIKAYLDSVFTEEGDSP